ncbi:hypothetical protein L1987_15545 [Smallanthus sonchifolius]|uniref:Uncharacterized protein n=1 Tax=Smallanthus sonchifolius TaxID=185202 RepID=A0ACB9J9C0_9ASTR|nr:hypothetical protein L1987_15545 [Smallanthus sonchifolius]
MKGVAVRLSYEEEAGDDSCRTLSQQIGQQIQQLNISTPNTTASEEPGVIPHSVSTPVMGIVSRGPTQVTSKIIPIPTQQGPIPAGPQLPMSQLLVAQNIPVSSVHSILSLAEYGDGSYSPLPGWTICPLQPSTTQCRKRRATGG